MHMAEAPVGFGDYPPAILDRSQIGPQEQRRHAMIGRNPVANRLAALLIAAGDDDARGAGRGQASGDCRAEPLRCAGDDADFAVHPVHWTTSYPANAIAGIRPSWTWLMR